MARSIVYQGLPGAYSHLACMSYYDELEPVSCRSFAAAFDRVNARKADLAMIPVENSVAGRVSDIYHLMPECGLRIVAEHYLPVHHCFAAIPGAKLKNIKTAYSHPMALLQVRKRLRKHGMIPVNDVDTAGAAKRVAELGDPSVASVSSGLAAKTYGLEILQANIEDSEHNTTRFLVLARKPNIPKHDAGPVVTSFVFKVRNVPSALYKAMGGFATNGINMTKLESYMIEGSFAATQFYADVEGHPDDTSMQHAMEELEFFTEHVTLLGTYPAHSSRGL